MMYKQNNVCLRQLATYRKIMRIYHGGSEKKIWYIVLFQKKYVEKGTTT